MMDSRGVIIAVTQETYCGDLIVPKKYINYFLWLSAAVGSIGCGQNYDAQVEVIEKQYELNRQDIHALKNDVLNNGNIQRVSAKIDDFNYLFFEYPAPQDKELYKHILESIDPLGFEELLVSKGGPKNQGDILAVEFRNKSSVFSNPAKVWSISYVPHVDPNKNLVLAGSCSKYIALKDVGWFIYYLNDTNDCIEVEAESSKG